MLIKTITDNLLLLWQWASHSSQSYSYMEQRKVKTEVDQMTGIELGTLQLRRPRTDRLSYVCFWEYYDKTIPPLFGMTWKSTM